MQTSFIQFIKQLPFVRLIFPFLIGIIFQIYLSLNLSFAPFFIIISLIILIVIELIKLNNYKFKFRFISGVFVNVLLVLTGAYLVKVNTPNSFEDVGKEIIGEAILSEPPSEKAKTFKTFASLKKYSLNDTVIQSSQKIVLYFEKDSFSSKLKYGDKIIFKSRLNEIITAGNPYEFNYKKFLFNKGIVAQAYIRKHNWKNINENEGWQIFKFAYYARKFLSEIYKSHNIGGQEFAVLQALTLGDKSEIDEDTRKSYVASGAMHILAVSGLHVGIIYMILNFLLQFLDRFKTEKRNYGSFIKATILILFLWTFALISGLSPSVRRAALMFSFVIIGRTVKNKVSIYNSISASAFILLLIEPYQITNVGFQLSYAAVISIIHFQPKIAKLFVIKNKILYYFWSLTAVSIAAQIGTAPISMFYFHVFPNYFFLANLIVIPLAFVIVIGASLLFVFSAVPYLSTGIAIVLKWVIWLLNSSVGAIEKLPFSYTENISFNIEDVFFLEITIILIAVFFTYKQAKSLIKMLVVLLIWISFNSFQKTRNSTNTKLYVYNIKGKSAINFIGSNNVLISDSSIFEDESIRYGIKSNWEHLNKTDFTFVNLFEDKYKSDNIFKYKSYIKSNSSNILIISNKEQVEFEVKDKLFVDFIIISNNVNVSINDILNVYKTKKIIIDSSNKFYKTERLIYECKNLNQDYFSVTEDGAFKVIL